MAEDELFASLRLESEAYQKRNSKVFQNYEVMEFVAEVIRAIPEFLAREPYFFEKEEVENLIRGLKEDRHGLVICACWAWAKRFNSFAYGHFTIEFIQKLEDRAAAAELFANDNILNIANALESIEWQKFRLPVEIMEKRLKWLEGQYKTLENKEAFKTFVEQAPKLDQHVTKVGELAAEVNSLNEALEKQKTEFNFVGLNQGFDDIRKKKLSELCPVKWFSRFLIFMVLVLPIGLLVAKEVWSVSGLEANLQRAIPILGLELLALYFYRVNLQHMRSIKAQMVQLELRQALCQFIESYAKYSKKIKDDNGAALDKFENLIFSGLAVNENAVPTSFDGLEPLANLIKSFKK
jgi:hypothetical protein